MNEETAEIVQLPISQTNDVALFHRRGTDVAGACREIVLQTALTLGDRRFVRVEGWQAIANAFGLYPSIESVTAVDGGVCAWATMHTPMGPVRAEGFVGDDEHQWYGCPSECKGHLDKWKKIKRYEARPKYARRAMAQTRAISRVCRSVLAFVVKLIDANLSTTPAEEMNTDDIVDVETTSPSATPPPVAPPKGAAELKARVEAAQAKAARQTPPSPRPANDSPAPTRDRSLTFPFGPEKHVALDRLSETSLRFYLRVCEEEVADPKQAQYHARAASRAAAIRAELKFRNLSV